MNETWLTEELIRNTYLYCWKRLRNTPEAEDLAQEILTEALAAWRKSSAQIDAPYGWFWSLAHRQYCLYLRRKKHNAVSLEEVSGILPMDAPDPSEELIRAEERSALNLAISRLSAIHRETIIRYYLRGEPVAQIARVLGIPEGTVKRRLHDARAQIKEDITMTEQTGRSAYAPVQLNLSGSYSIPDYWNHINDLMSKQILADCYQSPKSPREIADEIGVAPVYFEEKLRYLTENQFLKEAGNGKYLTDFIILPYQAAVYHAHAVNGITKELGRELTELLYKVEPQIRAQDFHGNDFPYPRLLWIFYTFAAQVLMERMQKLYDAKSDKSLPKNNGKTYRLTGTLRYPDEQIDIPANMESRHVDWSNLHHSFRTSGYRSIQHANLFQQHPFPRRDDILTEANMDLFMRLYDNPALTLTETEQETVAFWMEKGYMTKAESGHVPAIPIMTWQCKERIHAILDAEIVPLAEKYMEALLAATETYYRPHVREDLREEYVHWLVPSNFFQLNPVLYYALHEGNTLEIPEDYNNSAAAICIYICS